MLDFDDVEHEKIKARIAVVSDKGVPLLVWGPRRLSPLRRWGDLPGRAFSQLEARRWPGSITRRGGQADQQRRGRTGCTRRFAVTRP